MASTFRLSLGVLSAALLAAPFAPSAADSATLTVQVNQPGADISPMMFGVFFEDINLGADGGLYAELVKNRSFEFPEALMGWTKSQPAGASGGITVEKDDPLNEINPHYARLKSQNADGGVGLVNEGFRGMGVRAKATYIFSTYARQVEGGPLALSVELVDADGQTIAHARLKGFNSRWKQHSVTLRAKTACPKAKLKVVVAGAGTLDLDMVSLFPKDTWKHRPNGLRADLVQLLKDMRPGFVRFPGGCIVEGYHLATRYQWKKTIGDPAQRPTIINRWNNEFKHRPTPDYYQSFGLGFYEYFLLCEDIGAEPLPIINCGMACQFNSGELAPLDQLESYIQDALDLIEFANGPVTSRWGRQRAAMGHPARFNLKMLGVGNEQWGPDYVVRAARFAKVLKDQHPDIMLISSAGPDPSGDKFDFLWPKLRALKADIIDEHYYRPPQWFLDNAGRYDDYNRQDPKVFAGEYAAQSVATVSPANRNNWECALAEAAFITGLERNADVVRMASYAPLFAHEEGWQWRPDLIWFDNLRSYGTPNYYAQKLFSANRGATMLPVQLDGAVPKGQQKLYASASRDDRTGEVILKIVNAGPQARELRIQLAGARKVSKLGKAIVLASDDLRIENSLDQPLKIAPVEAKIRFAGPVFNWQAPASSMTVLRVGCLTR